MDDWAKVAELTMLMVRAFLQRGVSQEASAYTATVDRAADAWLRRWNFQDPELELPPDGMLARVLLARFRYAAAAATQYAMLRFPFPRASASTVLHLLLCEEWYRSHRARWLSGERGTAFDEN